MVCRYCGGDQDEPDHAAHCDGRQGRLEWALTQADEEVELHARGSDPATSHEAMAAYDPDRMRSAVEMVVELYARVGPMPDYDLQREFDTTFTQPHCRHLYQQARSSARDQGRIYDTGVRVVNPTTKRRQIVWAYNPAPVPPVKEFCPTCGALRARDGVTRRRQAS